MDLTSAGDLLRHNLDAVEQRIQAACARSGRKRSDVLLVAVTKTISVELTRLLPELGIVDLGENRPQSLWPKAAQLSAPIHWHLIGHLQRNKIAKTLPIVSWIHSVDSVRLLQALEEEAVAQKRDVSVLLEVNASGEASKHGFDPNTLPDVAPIANQLRHVRVRGLMTMAALQDAQACRPTFRALREMRDRLKPTLDEPHCLEHLSMGMSNDFEVAIEEGATFIRLGSVLFEGLPT